MVCFRSCICRVAQMSSYGSEDLNFGDFTVAHTLGSSFFRERPVTSSSNSGQSDKGSGSGEASEDGQALEPSEASECFAETGPTTEHLEHQENPIAVDIQTTTSRTIARPQAPRQTSTPSFRAAASLAPPPLRRPSPPPVRNPTRSYTFSPGSDDWRDQGDEIKHALEISKLTTEDEERK